MASSTGVSADEASDDAELAEALQREDPLAYRVAWQRFSPLVRRLIQRRFHSASDVEDLTQDVFTSLFVAVHELRKLEALRAFVTAVTLRRVGEEQRRRRRRFRATEKLEQVLEVERDLLRSTPVDTDVASRGACADLERLLARLRPRERHAYVLRFIDGMKVEEIAEALEVSVPTARRSFSYAKTRINGWASHEPSLRVYARRASLTPANE
jgi:RNA polymerase sigma-70 factor (ECF subfamily)